MIFEVHVNLMFTNGQEISRRHKEAALLSRSFNPLGRESMIRQSEKRTEGSVIIKDTTLVSLHLAEIGLELLSSFVLELLHRDYGKKGRPNAHPEDRRPTTQTEDDCA